MYIASIAYNNITTGTIDVNHVILLINISQIWGHNGLYLGKQTFVGLEDEGSNNMPLLEKTHKFVNFYFKICNTKRVDGSSCNLVQTLG